MNAVLSIPPKFLAVFSNREKTRRYSFNQPMRRACFPGPVSDRVGRSRDVPLDGDAIRATQSSSSGHGGAPGGMGLVKLSWLCSSARRLEWLAYDDLLASWTGAFGGPGPAGIQTPTNSSVESRHARRPTATPLSVGDPSRGTETAEPLTPTRSRSHPPSGFFRHGVARAGFRPRSARLSLLPSFTIACRRYGSNGVSRNYRNIRSDMSSASKSTRVM